MSTVAEILDRKGRFVATVDPQTSVLEAAREMNARRIGALVVTRENRVLGIFTERDILTRVVVAQLDPAKTEVAQVMTTPVACCRPDTTLAECGSLMTVKRIRHLPVVEEGRLAGIITIGDLTAREVVDHKTTIEYLHQYIYGPQIHVAQEQEGGKETSAP